MLFNRCRRTVRRSRYTSLKYRSNLKCDSAYIQIKQKNLQEGVQSARSLVALLQGRNTTCVSMRQILWNC